MQLKDRNVPDIKVGGRYSRRTGPAPGLEYIDPDTHNLFTGATKRFKAWALDYLQREAVPALQVVERAKAAGWINEGEALREFLGSIPGTESDDGVMLAARIYSLCRLVEEFQTAPELFRPGQGHQAIFELGRLSMLARVYGIDDAAAAKRNDRAVDENTKYTKAERDQWRDLYASSYAGMSMSSAARLIASRQGLPKAAEQTIRKVLAAKVAK